MVYTEHLIANMIEGVEKGYEKIRIKLVLVTELLIKDRS